MSLDARNKMTQFIKIFSELNTQKSEESARAKWPVIIRQHYHRQPVCYEYQYPKVFFINLQLQQKIIIPYELIKAKSSRLTFVKMIIDKHMKRELDIFTYHFGMYLIYQGYHRAEQDDFSDASIGKKRAQFVRTLPVSCFLSEDDFIAAVWSSLIETRETDIDEYRRNPFLKDVRILFSNQQFASWTGIDYPGDVTWVEPISGKLDLECRKWSEENDPMVPVRIPEGWVQGAIVLEDDGVNGLRHYVKGVPVHAGSAVQVKFGNGWISGRYEWSFDGKSKIQIHCHDDVIYISEGHQVRVKD